MGSVSSSGSNMIDLEQILNEPLIFLEGKKKTADVSVLIS